jgi:DNA repair exonuclease SbcCD ATPase subunit
MDDQRLVEEKERGRRNVEALEAECEKLQAALDAANKRAEEVRNSADVVCAELRQRAEAAEAQIKNVGCVPYLDRMRELAARIEKTEQERDEAIEGLERVGVFVDQEIAKIPTVLRGENEALIYEHIRLLMEPRKGING